MKKHATTRSTWIRGLYMLLFALIYNVAEVVVLAVALFQFIVKLLTGNVNGRLLELGNSLSIYVCQIWRFLTFNSETLPFPFGPWPQGTQGSPDLPEQLRG
ncbi:MAG: DUF4389 domain-containing protein [Pseudomonadota bacterium]|nr:DUF4389 domain-containing protein [Pseudomonadota bacterium]